MLPILYALCTNPALETATWPTERYPYIPALYRSMARSLLHGLLALLFCAVYVLAGRDFYKILDCKCTCLINKATSAHSFLNNLFNIYILQCLRRLIISPTVVDRSASEADIKKAYKRLSRKFHPDRNKEAGAESKFVEITQGMSLL